MNTSSTNTNKADRPWAARLTRRRLLMAAYLLIATGYMLMAGPSSTEQAFCADIFSARRIAIAPALCLTGYLLIIVGILKK